MLHNIKYQRRFTNECSRIIAVLLRIKQKKRCLVLLFSVMRLKVWMLCHSLLCRKLYPIVPGKFLLLCTRIGQTPPMQEVVRQNLTENLSR